MPGGGRTQNAGGGNMHLYGTKHNRKVISAYTDKYFRMWPIELFRACWSWRAISVCR